MDLIIYVIVHLPKNWTNFDWLKCHSNWEQHVSASRYWSLDASWPATMSRSIRSFVFKNFDSTIQVFIFCFKLKLFKFLSRFYTCIMFVHVHVRTYACTQNACTCKLAIAHIHKPCADVNLHMCTCTYTQNACTCKLHVCIYTYTQVACTYKYTNMYLHIYRRRLLV